MNWIRPVFSRPDPVVTCRRRFNQLSAPSEKSMRRRGIFNPPSIQLKLLADLGGSDGERDFSHEFRLTASFICPFAIC